jgi:CheY-like chemotaxis protein
MSILQPMDRMPLRAVQERPPDVVLLDLGLPKMDGWEVARQIRQRSNGRRPLLVAISGYGTEADPLPDGRH